MNPVAPQSRRLLPIAGHTAGRSAMTCRYRCGDACFGEIPNTSDNAYFGDIVSKSPSRRTMLKAGGVGATMGLLAAWAVAEPDPSNAAVAGKRSVMCWSFASVEATRPAPLLVEARADRRRPGGPQHTLLR